MTSTYIQIQCNTGCKVLNKYIDLLFRRSYGNANYQPQ